MHKSNAVYAPKKKKKKMNTACCLPMHSQNAVKAMYVYVFKK